MDITFRCPECREKFRVEVRYAGRDWRCTNCSAEIVIPNADETPVERVKERRPVSRRWEEDEEYEPPISRKGFEWMTFRTGLTVLNAGLLTFSVALFAVILVAFIVAVGDPNDIRGGARRGGMVNVLAAVGLVFVLAALASVVLWVIGKSMTCSIPRESGATGLAAGSLICTIAAVLCATISIIIFVVNADRLQDPRGVIAVFVILCLIALVVALTGLTLFVFVLRSVALYFRNGSLAVHAVIYVIFALVFFLGSTAALFVIGATSRPEPAAMFRTQMVVSLIFYLGLLGVLIWLIVLIGLARVTIPKPSFRRRPREEYD